MKSTTVKFNIFMLLSALIATAAAYTTFPNIPHALFVGLSIATMVFSQAITFFNPSGEFVGHGQNWSTGKWITRIGVAILSIFAFLKDSGWALAAVALLTPLIEIIVRVYGSATEDQIAASKSK